MIYLNRFLIAREPEPLPDEDHLQRAHKLGLFPGWHLFNMAVKRVEWQRRQTFWSRLRRGCVARFSKDSGK